jgi:TPR repeat protein
MSDGGNSSAPASSSGQQQQQQPQEVVFLSDGRLAHTTKLSAVVTDAVHRWYLEAEREASRGDIKAQALLGQMLIEGYGCKADPEKGKEWAERARRRGYRMQGVYCEI